MKVCRSFIEKDLYPDEIVGVEGRPIVYHEGNIMITEWDAASEGKIQPWHFLPLHG